MSLSVKAQVEGILFATGNPVKAKLIAELLEVDASEVKTALDEIEEGAAHVRRLEKRLYQDGVSLKDLAAPMLPEYVQKIITLPS